MVRRVPWVAAVAVLGWVFAVPAVAQTPTGSTPPAAQAASDTGQQGSVVDTYAWADACKDCHAKYYDAWEKTKHATALRRLSGGDRENNCISCHVTGPKQLLDKNVNANIQCEECHGAGKAHIAAAAAGNAKPGNITRKPSEKMCVDCHSAKSPHFKFFSYPALAPLIHQVSK